MAARAKEEAPTPEEEDAHLTRLLIATVFDGADDFELPQNKARAETLRAGLAESGLKDRVLKWLRRHEFAEMADDISAELASGRIASTQWDVACSSVSDLRIVERELEEAGENTNYLDLSYHEIVEFGPGIDLNDGIDVIIELIGNNLESLPTFRYTKPTSIDVRENRISGAIEITPDTFASACGGLVLDDNQITEVTNITTDLKSLSLEKNQVSKLSNLPQSLEGLDVRKNLLKELPPLPESLERLYVCNNCLESLPPLPPKLKYLFASDNHLTTLPRLPETLTNVDLEGNPWDADFIAALGGKCPEDFEKAEDLVRAVNAAVGQGRAIKAARAG